jgi:hypothetical protein
MCVLCPLYSYPSFFGANPLLEEERERERAIEAKHTAGAQPLHEHLLKLLQSFQHHNLRRLLQFPCYNILIQDGVHFMEVKHQVQLAHIAKEPIQHLYKQVDAFQVGQLIIRHVHAKAEEETRIPTIDDLVGAKLNKVGELGVTRRHQAMHFILNLPFVVLLNGHVPLGQTSLALPVLKEEEADLQRR